jgi:hypothetical protein
MKADKWHSLITVDIHIALMSLWGASTSHPSDEVGTNLRAVLNHTMELVCMVYLTCTRTTTVERAHMYHSHIVHYVGNLKKIYPNFTLRPNHHTAFHIYDYLLLFGLAHSWWCFPFECLIGIFQCLPVNHKTGEFLRNISVIVGLTFQGKLETTMLYSFIKTSKLHCWLSQPDCLPAIQECKFLFDSMYAPKSAGTLGEELAEDRVLHGYG